MTDRRGVKIESVDAEKNEVHLETGEVITKNVCDIYLGGGHYAKSCIDHYRPWL